MTTKEIQHCGVCKHFENKLCKLRNEEIEYPNRTTCHNWNDNETRPGGVMYSIIGEMRNGAVAHISVPYFNGLRVNDIHKGNFTSLVWQNLDGQKIVFSTLQEYLSFCENEMIKKKRYIFGAIIGDIIGSVFEWENNKTTDFHLFSKNTDFTDDSVLTFATIDCILNQTDYTKAYQYYGRKFPNRGYGGNFESWIYDSHPKPYNSWGNGSAMRVSPVGWAYKSLSEVLHQAKRSAEVTHNHPEGIKGAQATASAIFLAKNHKSKADIKEFIENTFQYNLDRKIEEIRPVYNYDVSCQGSVPEAIIAFLESTGFEDAIRLAVSIGGDSDTIACITGGIAEAFYKEIPEFLIENSLKVLPSDAIKLIEDFSMQFRNLE